MLIEFTASNFRSFGNPCTLSMVASKDKDLPGNVVYNAEGTGYDLLRVVGVFGPNASGKSNLFKAVEFFRTMIRDSAKESQTGERIATQPFRFDPSMALEPSEFEIVFILNQRVYRYGFACTQERITGEYLHDLTQKSRMLMERTEDSVTLGRSLKKRATPQAIRGNALWLSQAAMLGHDLAAELVRGITGKTMGLGDWQSPEITDRLIRRELCKSEEVLSLLQRADLNISSFEFRDIPLSEAAQYRKLPDPLRAFLLSSGVGPEKVQRQPKFIHNALIAGKQISADFDEEDESDGTIKLFNLAGAMLDSLSQGYGVFADELDLRLHPLLLEMVLRLFLDAPEKCATQLIFSAHSLLAMDEGFLGAGASEEKGAPLLRRDQIYFTEKGPDAATRLYSLWDYGSTRKGEDRRRRYLKGRYRAVPQIEYHPVSLPEKS